MPTFDQVFEDESRSYGPAVWRESLKYAARRDAIEKGKAPATLEDFLPTGPAVIVSNIFDTLVREGVEQSAAGPKVVEYLHSPDITSIPFVKLQSLIYASAARQMVQGKKVLPNAGFDSDVQFISTFLPYCDAILVDREMRGLLTQGQLSREVEKFGCHVFSASVRDELFDYLNAVEDKATEQHLRLVAEVYGSLS